MICHKILDTISESLWCMVGSLGGGDLWQLILISAMERDTGAKIIIRGKGSVKEGKVGRKDGQPLPGEDEPLHAYVTANNPEAVKKAVDRVRKKIVNLRCCNTWHLYFCWFSPFICFLSKVCALHPRFLASSLFRRTYFWPPFRPLLTDSNCIIWTHDGKVMMLVKYLLTYEAYLTLKLI